MTASNSEGSQTATISVEHTLTTITSSGSFVLGVDNSNMVLGDRLVLRVKLKVRSTGTTRLAYEATYLHNQGIPVALSIPIPSTNEAIFTLEQTFGTGRTFEWEVWEL